MYGMLTYSKLTDLPAWPEPVTSVLILYMSDGCNEVLDQVDCGLVGHLRISAYKNFPKGFNEVSIVIIIIIIKKYKYGLK